jgi:hypothetical protein
MAAFDANLMLRSTTQTVSTNQSSGFAGLTGNWLTLGTGKAPANGLSFRAVISTSAGSNTDTLNLIYEFSDDQSTVRETVTQLVTGTDAGSGTASGALSIPTGDVLTRVAPKRTYVRLRLQTGGINANFGTVVCGVDVGDYNVHR